MEKETITVNRAPVLTLWAAVVAERLGYDHNEALSLGKALAGINAQSKGRRLGIYKPSEEAAVTKPKAEGLLGIELMGRIVPAKKFAEGLRAACEGKAVDAGGVERYLEQKFGEALGDVTKAMKDLAAAFSPRELAARAFSLYERFRPVIPDGVHGWGVKGELSLDRIKALSKKG